MIYIKSFIEEQFPVSKISKESYKERKANNGQTLTGLGKWWGRKPLILVRATILGLLMPASSDPKKDREIFLKILSMDEDGLLLRYKKPINKEQIKTILRDSEKKRFIKTWQETFTDEDTGEPITFTRHEYNLNCSPEELRELKKRYLKSLSYDKVVEDCVRPENMENISQQAWADINKHLGTSATSLPELITQLGQKQFGHTPRVGDAFCGGGSVPFEAARIGCEAYASDLNPVAALLTWSSLNIVGGGEKVIEQVKQAQKEVFDVVNKQVIDWGIEHNEKGWRADAYIYCVEVRCPMSGYVIPLIPSLVIGEKTKCIGRLIRNDIEKRYDVAIVSGVADDEMQKARVSGTMKDSCLINPDTGETTPIATLRGDRVINGKVVYGLRMWGNNDLIPRPEDVFQERLYCIRYVEDYYLLKTVVDGEKIVREISLYESNSFPGFSDLLKTGNVERKTRKHYVRPTNEDLIREEKVLTILKERFYEWQSKGYIPNRIIESGEKTDEPIRTRGWTYWHHLFNPRQLLINALFSYHSQKYISEPGVGLTLGLGKNANWNSRLTRWDSSPGSEKSAETFSNQALNTLYNFSVRPTISYASNWFYTIRSITGQIKKGTLNIGDSRKINVSNDLWITDPPYADAVNYHELSDFFLVWYQAHLTRLFPEWYTDGKKALAIKGSDEDFRHGMVEAYSNLSKHMPENGAQVVMFTHQDASVWADLALILWASGLQVTAAWTISTETDSALKAGNYVQGTVIMVLRKQVGEEETFLNDVYPEVEEEVIKQVQRMIELDDKEDPNFADADYQLAAYAAALRVLTRYKLIHPINVQYELSKTRIKNEKNEVERLIGEAVKIATNYLIPDGLDRELWLTLSPVERFYLKGMEVESHGEYRNGVYQELARGFGIPDYRLLLNTSKANQTRLLSALEYKSRGLRDLGFGASAIRNILFAIHETHYKEAKVGRQWLKDEVKDYWNNRQRLISLTRYLANLGSRIERWEPDYKAAELLVGSLENDHV